MYNVFYSAEMETRQTSKFCIFLQNRGLASIPDLLVYNYFNNFSYYFFKFKFL